MMENSSKTESPVDIASQDPSTEMQVQNGGGKTLEDESSIIDDNAKTKTVEKKSSKKSKEEKRSKEEEKRIKLLLRGFEGLENSDAKLNALARKYVQLTADTKSLEYKKDDLESKNEKLTKERDSLQSDYNKATLAKSKLESLCRELQKHSKLVKEECQLRAQEEEAKRKELSDRFQTTINDISQQMQDNFKRNEQLKLENEELATKLKGLVSQYETREEHVDKVVQHKQLELQLAEAKMAQQSLQFNEMKEKSLIEKQELIKDSLDYRKRYEIMVKQEAELKSQLAMYTERFDDFQATLNKSNEVFATFKREMDKMTKTIKKLEKENKALKSKGENTSRSLLAMLEERSNMEKQIKALSNKNSKLENLCRAMQKNQVLPNKENPTANEESEPIDSNSLENTNSFENIANTNDVNSGIEESISNDEPNNDQEASSGGEYSNEGGSKNGGEPQNEGSEIGGYSNWGTDNDVVPDGKVTQNDGQPNNEGEPSKGGNFPVENYESTDVTESCEDIQKIEKHSSEQASGGE